jgi:Cu/Ag efflux protein CusF
MKTIVALFALALIVSPAALANDQTSGSSGSVTAASGQKEMMCTVVSVNAENNQVTLDHNGMQHTITPTGDSSSLQELKKGDSVHVMLDENDQTKGAVHKQ